MTPPTHGASTHRPLPAIRPSVYASNPLRKIRCFLPHLALLLTGSLASAVAQTTITWTAPTDTTFSTGSNWNPGAPANDATASGNIAAFATVGLANPVLTASQAVAGLSFTATGYTLSATGGATLTLGDSGLTNATGATTIVSAPLAGTGGVINSGTLTLSGANTYSGGTTLNAGSLALTDASALGTGILTVNGGALDNTSGSALTLTTNNAQAWNGNFTFTGSSNLNLGTGAVSLGGNRTVTVSANTLTVGGAIGDGGSAYSLTKAGTGTLVLSGTNTYTGGTTISAGTLQIGSGSTGSLVGNIVNHAALTFNRSGTLTYADVISGTGTLRVSTGTLILTGANTFTGTTTVTSGTLKIGNGGTTGSIQGNISQSGGTVTFSRSDAITYSGTMTGTGAVSFTGGGTLTLTGNSSTTATLLVSSGTVQFGNGGTSGSWGGAITNNAALVYNRSNAVTQSVAISGTGSLTKLGAGTLSLSRGNTYSGGTIISAGTLEIGLPSGSVASGSITGSVVNNATLRFNRTGSLTYAGVISGSGAVTQVGAGTITLSGASTYTGGTTVSGGTLQLSGSGGLGSTSGALTVNGGTVDLNGVALGVGNFTGTGGTVVNNATGTSVTLTLGNGNGTGGTYAGVVADHTSGTGTLALTKAGTGTLTLSGANTYTGATAINAGILTFAQQTSLYNNTGASWTAANLVIASGATVGFRVGGTGEFTTSDIATLAALGSSSGGFTSGSFLGLDTTNAPGGTFTYSSALADPNSGGNALGLTKLGTGTLVLSGANTYTGATTVSAGTLTFSQQTSLYNNNPASWTASNLTVNSGATAAFNVGGAGEFTSSDIATLAALGGSATGFRSGSLLGLDTTNATGGTFTLTTSLANPNGGTNALGLVKLGTGTLTLSAANIYTGTTMVSAGTLSAGVASVANVSGAFGNNSAVSLANTAGAILDLGTFDTQIGSLTGGGGTGGNVNLGAGTLTLGGDNTSPTAFAGAISGTGGLTKVGTGTQMLSGANTYTGATTISGGILSVNGSLAITTVAVASGGTLGGSGSIGGATTVQSGGNLAPGNSLGLLTFTNGLTLASGSTSTFEINGTGRGTTYDAINITGGTLTYGGTLTLNFGSTVANGTTLGLFGLTGTNVAASDFNYVTSLGSYTGSFTNNGGIWTYSDGTQLLSFAPSTGDLSFSASAIPEPATYAVLLGLAALGTAAYRRRSPAMFLTERRTNRRVALGK